jgi:hypothetical protein
MLRPPEVTGKAELRFARALRQGQPSAVELSAPANRLADLVPGVFSTPENIRTLKKFYLIGEAYEIHGATSQGSVGKQLEIGKNNINNIFTKVQTLLQPIGVVFERSSYGRQERISGLSEVGRMAWRMVAEVFFNDIDV